MCSSRGEPTLHGHRAGAIVKPEGFLSRVQASEFSRPGDAARELSGTRASAPACEAPHFDGHRGRSGPAPEPTCSGEVHPPRLAAPLCTAKLCTRPCRVCAASVERPLRPQHAYSTADKQQAPLWARHGGRTAPERADGREEPGAPVPAYGWSANRKLAARFRRHSQAILCAERSPQYGSWATRDVRVGWSRPPRSAL